jgi:hypothetical protein
MLAAFTAPQFILSFSLVSSLVSLFAKIISFRMDATSDTCTWTAGRKKLSGGGEENDNDDDYDDQQKVTTYQTPTSHLYWLLA